MGAHARPKAHVYQSFSKRPVIPSPRKTAVRSSIVSLTYKRFANSAATERAYIVWPTLVNLVYKKTAFLHDHLVMLIF